MRKIVFGFYTAAAAAAPRCLDSFLAAQAAAAGRLQTSLALQQQGWSSKQSRVKGAAVVSHVEALSFSSTLLWSPFLIWPTTSKAKVSMGDAICVSLSS